MSELKTIIGACGAARNSTRNISTISVDLSFSATGAYHNPNTVPPTEQTGGLSGGVSKSWARKMMPDVGQEIGDTPSPGEGYFYLIDYGCGCCPCHSAFVFDDGVVPVPESQPNGISLDAYDGVQAYVTGATIGLFFTPAGTYSGFDEDPTPGPITFSLWMWNHLSGPCKKQDGPINFGAPPDTMFAQTSPADFGDTEWLLDPGSTVITTGYSVSGSDDVALATVSVSSALVTLPRFNSPKNCATLHEYSVDYSQTISESDDFGDTLDYFTAWHLDFTIGA